MREAPAKQSIWSTVIPIYRVLRVFGLTPFSVVGEIKNGKIKSNVFDGLQLCIVLCVQLYVLYINFKEDLSMSRTNSPLIDKGAYLIENFNVLNILLGTSFYAVYRKKIWRIFSKFYQFDKEVKSLNCFEKLSRKAFLQLFKLGFDMNNRFRKSLVIGYLTMFVIFLTVFLTSCVLVSKLNDSSIETIKICFCYLLTNLYNCLFFTGFCAMLAAVLRRFEAINECIRFAV